MREHADRKRSSRSGRWRLRLVWIYEPLCASMRTVTIHTVRSLALTAGMDLRAAMREHADSHGSHRSGR